MENIQDISSGKMSSGLSPATREKISRQSLTQSSKLKLQRLPRCLCLKMADGHMQTYSWETDGALLTELLTHSIGEYPSAAVESTLSQILEVRVQEKYYLSQRACQGILRRAAARGKELPAVLKRALERQALLTA